MSAKRNVVLGIVILLLSFSSAVFAEDEVDKLILQVKGEAQFFDAEGKELGFFASWSIRHFDEQCRIAAATLLGRKGGLAAKAVDPLIMILKNGPNDIDTGDGILPMRSSVALALGRINDPKAIGPLLEKLKQPEPAAVLNSTSLASGSTPKTGLEQEAIVRALGMFGGQAKEAVPVLEELQRQTTNESLKKTIENTIYRIQNDKFIMPEDFY
ncbi:MAG TPA: HEAT repeat domain-containing protein [Candidatus Ozemobacteraceae bacterium]|nr:HEAT repeat domain-containing protein [Candidatus Ozemobacteraceae bacterium]HQG28116.1 HEAT repeat domain-containing protein [Candidatus Ozemobacteraceae bacterium]